MKILLSALALLLFCSTAAHAAECLTSDFWLHGKGSVPAKVLLDIQGDTAKAANDRINNIPPVTHNEIDHFIVIRPDMNQQTLIIGLFNKGCLLNTLQTDTDQVLRNFGVDLSQFVGQPS